MKRLRLPRASSPRAALRRRAGAAREAAASLTGKRFGLLVASSVVATSAIVAAGMSGTGGGFGPLAAALGRNLAASPVAAEAPASSTGVHDATPPQPESGAEAAPSSSGPLPSPGPAEPEAPPSPAPKQEAPGREPEPAVAPSGPVKHVFVVSLASPGYEAAFGAASQMPYLSGTLRPQGDLLTNFELLDDASTANGIATISGQPPNPASGAGCPTYSEVPATAKVSFGGVVSGSGCVYPVATLTLADQLESSRLSWRAYMEGMADPTTGKPANCVHPEPGAAEAPPSGGYSSKLNPFAYFHSLLDLGACATGDVPGEELAKDLKKTTTTPNLAYIAPDLCDAGFPGQCPAGAPEGAAAADAHLATLIPQILASPAFKADGLLIVTFNSIALPPPAPGQPAPAPTDTRVGTLLVSPFLSPGASDGAAYDPYSLLRSIEDELGLEPLARAGGAKVRSFASQLSGGGGAGGGD